MAVRMGRLFGELARVFDDPAWDGLRQSHQRILEVLDADGSRLTDVARSLRMTKQGAGQLVASLVERQLVEQRPDPADRRAKVLVRTADGDAMVVRVRDAIADVEERWRQRAGEQDYATFRAVLDRLAP